jgi:hypothetical protein
MSILLRSLRSSKPDLKEIQKIINENPDSIYSKDIAKNFVTGSFHIGYKYMEDVMEFLIHSCPELLWKKNAYGEYPIHAALNNWYGPINLKVIQIFIDNMDISKIKHKSGASLLHFAARSHNLDAFELIFNLNPHAIYHKDNEGLLPYVYAIRKTHMKKYSHILPILKKLINPEIACIPTHIEGDLPLHIIVKHMTYYQSKITVYNLPLIEWVFTQNPSAILKKNSDGNTPFDISRTSFPFNNYMLDFLNRKTDLALNNEARKIQRAWKECRDNPGYKMCEKILVYNINRDCPGVLQ